MAKRKLSTDEDMMDAEPAVELKRRRQAKFLMTPRWIETIGWSIDEPNVLSFRDVQFRDFICRNEYEVFVLESMLVSLNALLQAGEFVVYPWSLVSEEHGACTKVPRLLYTGSHVAAFCCADKFTQIPEGTLFVPRVSLVELAENDLRLTESQPVWATASMMVGPPDIHGYHVFEDNPKIETRKTILHGCDELNVFCQTVTKRQFALTTPQFMHSVEYKFIFYNGRLRSKETTWSHVSLYLVVVDFSWADWLDEKNAIVREQVQIVFSRTGNEVPPGYDLRSNHNYCEFRVIGGGAGTKSARQSRE